MHITYIQSYIQPYIYTYIHPSIHTYIQTYIHAYIHTYIGLHTYIHTHIHVHLDAMHLNTLTIIICLYDQHCYGRKLNLYSDMKEQYKNAASYASDGHTVRLLSQLTCCFPIFNRVHAYSPVEYELQPL